jgi:hypothetical protein
MPETRKKYDREFREGAVRIVEETGKSIAQVARDLGVKEAPWATGWPVRLPPGLMAATGASVLLIHTGARCIGLRWG